MTRKQYRLRPTSSPVNTLTEEQLDRVRNLGPGKAKKYVRANRKFKVKRCID